MKALHKLRDILSRGLRGPASRTDLFDDIELVVERLEDRRLLSAGVTASLVGNVLFVQDANAATDDNLEIELSPDGQSISIFDHDLGQSVQINVSGFLFDAVNRGEVHKIEVEFHHGTNHLATPLIDQIDLQVTGGSGLDTVELTRDEGAYYSDDVTLLVERTVISGAGTYNAFDTTIGGDLEVADVSAQWIGSSFQVAGSITIDGSFELGGVGDLTLHDVHDGGAGHSQLILRSWTKITFDGDVSVDHLAVGDGFSSAIEQVDIYGHVDANTAYLRVDDLEIHPGGMLSGNNISIVASVDHDIHMGDVTNGAFLGISQDELDRIDANLLSFSTAGSGELVIVDDIDYSQGGLTLLSLADLTVEHDIHLGGSGTYLLIASGAGLHITSGAVLSVPDFGGITLQGNEGVVIDGGAQVSLVDGGLTVYGNWGFGSLADTAGILIDGATVEATGSGSFAFYGEGGGGAANQHGVVLRNGAVIRTGEYGHIEITGAGSLNSAGASSGIIVSEGSRIEGQFGASVLLTGTGGSSSTGGNVGVEITGSASGLVTQGTIQISGTGGSGGASGNTGLVVAAGALIGTTEYSDATLEGTAGAGESQGIVMTDGSVEVQHGTLRLSAAGISTMVPHLSISYSTITATGEGSIDAIADTIELSSSAPVFVIGGSGIITVAPLTAGRGVDLGWIDSATVLGISNVELSLMSGPVRIGDSATGDILVSRQITSANDLHLTSAGTITIADTILMGADRDFSALSLGTSADYGIDFVSPFSGVLTSGSGSMNIMADRGVRLTSGATLLTADGGIFVMGNSFATTGDEAGVLIDGGILSTSGTGQIQLIGAGDAAAYGVVLRNGAEVQAHPGATGRILLTGTVTGASSSRSGVLVDGSYLISDAGEIDISGRGGETGSGARGVEIIDSTIQNRGVERIRVSGTGGGKDSGNDGILIQDSVIEAAVGELGLYGTAGSLLSPTGEDSVGVRITGSGTRVSVNGDDLSIYGFGGTGTGATGGNLGVAILSGALVGTSGEGNVSISGTAGGTTQGNDGVRISGGVLVQSSGTGLAADKGKINVFGSGSGDRGNVGVEISNSANIITNEGDLTINGAGGSGSLDGNYGVVVDFASIRSDGRANVTIVGTGGSGGDGPARNDGLRIVNLGSVASTGIGLGTNEGKISLIGSSGGGSQGGYGVYLSESTVSSFDGEIFVTGNGNTGPGPNRTGVRLDNLVVIETTGAGTLRLNGSEGSGGGFGIEIRAGAAVRTTGTGAGDFGASSISVAIAAPLDFRFAGGVSFSTGTLAFNVISGTAMLNAAINAGDLVKEGIGELRLQGTSAVTSTTVNLGKLAIDGSLQSAVAVGLDGTLAGSGQITGNVINEGSLEGSLQIVGNVSGTGFVRPGGPGSGATLTIDGDFTPTGTVELELFSVGPNDLIAVTGTVDLSGAGISLFQSVTSPVGTTYTLITNDGGDPTIPFAGLAEGATVNVFGIDFAVTYLGGVDGNAFVLTQLQAATGTLTAVFDPQGHLVITDTAGVDNNLTIVQDGAGNLVITDANETFLAAPSGGTLSNGGRTLTIAASLITDDLIIVARDGDDVLTLDFRNGRLTNGTTLDRIDFQGGLGTDSLVILDTALSTAFQVAHETTVSTGAVNVQQNQVGGWVTFLDAQYSGVESIVDDLLAGHRQFVTHGGGTDFDLTDGTASDGRMTASISPTFNIDFDISITNRLDIDTLDGTNIVTIGSVDSGFSAGMEINGRFVPYDHRTDTVRILTDLHLGSATDDGFLNVWAGEIELGGDIDMSADDGLTGRHVTMNGHVTLVTDVAINTVGAYTDGFVYLAGVDGKYDLSINVGDGYVLLVGETGGSAALAALNLTARSIQLFSDIHTDGGPVVLDGHVTLAADPFFLSTVTIDTESGQDSAAGSVTITGTVSSTNPVLNLVIDTSTGTGLQAGAVSLGGADDYGTNILVADLIILAGGTGVLAGDVQVTGDVAISNNLIVQGRTITLDSGAEIALTGTSSASFDATRNIVLAANSSITAVDGDITLRANQGGTRTSGSFSGITLTQATIETSGLGDILLEGRAGGSATGNLHRGVVLENGSAVRSTTNTGVPTEGSITIVGEGAQGTGSLYIGVDLLNFGQVQSTGSAAISITGVGGSGSQNSGIRMQNLGGVASGGTGTVSINGSTVLLAGGATFSHAAVATIETDAGLDIQRSLTLDADVTGTGGVSVASSVIVTMTGDSDYSGATSVAGILFVDGSIVSSATVSGSAILGGTGTITGDVTLAGGTLRDALMINGNVSGSGTVSPGAFFGLATLTINGNLSLTGGTVEMQVDNSFGGADQIIVNGTVDLSGATLLLSGSIASNPGQSITLISNNDNDAVSPFSGVPEGTTVTIGVVNFTISYAGGPGGNDVVLTESVPTGTLTAHLVGGVLTITDASATATDNRWTIILDGATLKITDNTEVFGVNSTPGTLEDGGRTLRIAVTLVTGPIVFDGMGGSDTLTIDVSGGQILQAIEFDGGAGPASDALTLVGSLPSGQPWRSVTYQHVDASSGTITLATDAATTLVTYRGLEPILDELLVQSRIFRYGTASETVTLVAADPAHMTIDSEAAESVTFRAATVLTQIAGGDGDDVIRVISLSANFRGSLTIDGNAGNDRVELNANLVLGSGATLDVNLSNDAAPGDRDQIVVGPGTAITATGSGLIILKANQSITFGPGSSLTTENADARLAVDSTLTSNVFGFVGIDLNQATIRTTGTGAVELTASGQIVLGEGTLVVTGGRPVTLISTGSLADISIRGTINTQGGTITILSDDDADFGAAAVVRTGGGALTISADLDQNGVGGIRMLDGSLLDAGAGRVVITAAGDISVSRVRTTGEMIIVSRLGEIRDSDTNLGLDLEAGRLALVADKGIGRGNPLEIAVGTLAAMTSTGSIELVNQTGQTLEIGTVAGLPGLTNTDTGSGNISILTDGPLVVNAPVTSTAQYSTAPNGVEQGIVKIKSENPATETDDVIVNAPIDAPGAKVIIEAGDDVTLNDTGREIDIRGRIVTVAAGPQGQTGTETHKITLSVNTLIESSTGRVNSLTPALSNVTTNRIGGDGRAQVTFDYGNSLERNYTIIVDWGDGTQDVYSVPASGQLTLDHTYTGVVDPNNPSAGIPVKVTVLHDGNVSLYQASVSVTGAEDVQFNEVSGTGAQPEIVYVIAVDAPPMAIARVEALDTPVLQATIPQQVSAETDAAPGVERKLTQDEWVVVAQELDRQGQPVKDAQGRPVTRTFGPELTARLLSKIQSLYNELEEGRFKVYMQAGSGKPLLVIDVLLRNSRPVSDEEDIHERPEATEVEGTPAVTGQEPAEMTRRESGEEPPPPRPGGGDKAGPAGVREDLSGLDRPARSVLGWIAQRLKSIGLM